jgi:hypothetical protein
VSQRASPVVHVVRQHEPLAHSLLLTLRFITSTLRIMQMAEGQFSTFGGRLRLVSISLLSFVLLSYCLYAVTLLAVSREFYVLTSTSPHVYSTFVLEAGMRTFPAVANAMDLVGFRPFAVYLGVAFVLTGVILYWPFVLPNRLSNLGWLSTFPVLGLPLLHYWSQREAWAVILPVLLGYLSTVAAVMTFRNSIVTRVWRFGFVLSVLPYAVAMGSVLLFVSLGFIE